METKKCSKCEQVKSINEFYQRKGVADGHRYWCKDCDREYLRQYTKTGYFNEYQRKPEVRERINKNKLLYRQRFDVRIKNFARSYTNHQIRAGNLKREPCALCGQEQSEAHHLDYSEPLLIVWLCPNCHREAHLKATVGK